MICDCRDYLKSSVPSYPRPCTCYVPCSWIRVQRSSQGVKLQEISNTSSTSPTPSVLTPPSPLLHLVTTWPGPRAIRATQGTEQREEGEPVLRSLAWPETSDRRERGVRATGGHCLHQHLCCGEDTQQQRHSSFYEIEDFCLIRLKCCCDLWVHGEPASDRLSVSRVK